VADVPNKFVFWRAENEVKRQGKFDHSKIRAEVSAILCQNRNHFLPHFLGEDLQLLNSQLFDL
jgi:hypothetical protein